MVQFLELSGQWMSERSLISVLSLPPHLPRGSGSATEGAGGPLVQWQKGMEFQEVLWEAIK